ncbi:HEAT repeat domain-containing protein [Streptosporangium sp. KLBMP 9127]|nr:HEAT repeat domain-containing protein [Streptosporangium sp. KLBMP 9127]
MSQIDGPLKQQGSPAGDDESSRKPEAADQAESSEARPETDDDAPLSEKDALRALRRGGADDAESAQAAAIAARVTERLQRDSLGVRIDTLALFNDSVSIGGGFTMAGHSRGTGDTTIKVNKKRLARWTESYLRPPRWDDALDVLRNRGLLILALSPGGRKTTGFNLLAEVLKTHAEGECYRIVDSSALDGSNWPAAGSGYLLVLDDGSSGTAGLSMDTIDEQWIDDTAAILQESKSFMILVTGPPRGTLVEAAARSGHIMTSLGLVDPVHIVQSHAFDVPPTPEEIAELHRKLADSRALELLREVPRPRNAVHLAAVIRSGGDLAAGVESLRDPTDQVHAWFSQFRSPEVTSFALAAATLEEATYLTVSDAAMTLYGMLTPDTGSPADLRFRERLESDHPWIQVSVTAEETGRTKGSALPRVRFVNPLVQQAILGYAWTYLDGYRPTMLAWLRRLMTHPDIDVRARASVAAGVIAWSDHSHAVNRYLRQWAGNESPALRQGAATALGVVGGNRDLAEAVWVLLESWVAEKDTPFQRRLSLTAATTLGGWLGAQQPARATTALRTMLDREDWSTLPPVGRSLLHLIEQGCASEVLSALLTWSEPQDSSPMVTKSLSAFVFMASQPAPAEYPGGGALSWTASSPGDPPLPLLLANAREHLPQLVELWARALARKPAQTQALDALREYLDKYADHDRTAFSNIYDILLAVAARPGRHRERLDYYLDGWARAGKNPSGSAARIHHALRNSA